MLSFKAFLEEAKRTPERAAAMVDYIHRRRRDATNPLSKLINKMKSRSTNDFVNLIKYDSGSNVVDRAYAKYGNTFYDKFQTHGELRKVPLDSLYSAQQDVGKEQLKSKVLGTFRKDYHADSPVVPYIIHDTQTGKHHLMDGNHRAVKERLLGNKTFTGLVLDV